MKIFAHRGLSATYPENTLVAFDKAMDYKIDGIETDVQLTKDGEMVIFHDEFLNRTTGFNGLLKDYTLAELKELNANNHMEGTYKIPTLDELFDLIEKRGFKEKITLNLELKTSVFEYTGIEQKVYDCMMKHGFHDSIIISSFNHYSLLRFKEIDPTIRTGLLTGDRIVNAEEYARNTVKCDCYHPLFAIETPEKVALAHSLGLEVNVWTNDEPKYAKMLEMIGVDTMMTNACDKFKELY